MKYQDNTKNKDVHLIMGRVSGFNFHDQDHEGFMNLLLRQRMTHADGRLGLEENVHGFIRDLNLNADMRVDLVVDEGISFHIGPSTETELIVHPRHGQSTVSDMNTRAMTLTYGPRQRKYDKAEPVNKTELISLLTIFRSVCEQVGLDKVYVAQGNHPTAMVLEDAQNRSVDVAYVAQQLRIFIMNLSDAVTYRITFNSDSLDEVNPNSQLKLYVEIHDPDIKTNGDIPLVTFVLNSGYPVGDAVDKTAYASLIDAEKLKDLISSISAQYQFPDTKNNLEDAKTFMEPHRGNRNYSVLALALVNKHYAGVDANDPSVVEFLEALNKVVPAW